MKELKIMLDEGAVMPTRAHEGDAGLDLYSMEDVTVSDRCSATVSTGVHVEIPFGYEGEVRCRSGLNFKHGVTCEGTIDHGYTGDIRLKLYNHSYHPYTIKKGERVAQLVIHKCELPTPVLVDSFEESDRGEGGFGSTGR